MTAPLGLARTVIALCLRMATLHVRNVPDELYELLRACAAANDRSIGAETVQLLQERLALVRWRGATRRLPLLGHRRRGRGLSTRFTAPARRAVVAAQDQARELGHDHVGTDHLLLGILLQESTEVAGALRDHGLTAARAREEVVRGRGRGEAAPAGQIPFEPGAKQALELALRCALTLGDEAIGPAHLAVGILNQERDRGAEILRGVEADPEVLRGILLDSPRAPEVFSSVQEPVFRVVALEGDADAWERQLNEAASLGYDLVEVVDGRAILRRV